MNKDAEVFYMVRSWISPEGGQTYLDWLDTKHMAEVKSQPGIGWARRIDLDQTDDAGWKSVLLIYGFENRAALDAYMESPARDGFWEELKQFKGVCRSERFWGDVTFALD